jgi:hypothetical protein
MIADGEVDYLVKAIVGTVKSNPAFLQRLRDSSGKTVDEIRIGGGEELLRRRIHLGFERAHKPSYFMPGCPSQRAWSGTEFDR